jgi:hypothetical protein
LRRLLYLLRTGKRCRVSVRVLHFLG